MASDWNFEIFPESGRLRVEVTAQRVGSTIRFGDSFTLSMLDIPDLKRLRDELDDLVNSAEWERDNG